MSRSISVERSAIVGVSKSVSQTQFNTKGATNPADKLSAQQRKPPEQEEIIVNAYLVQTQQRSGFWQRSSIGVRGRRQIDRHRRVCFQDHGGSGKAPDTFCFAVRGTLLEVHRLRAHIIAARFAEAPAVRSRGNGPGCRITTYSTLLRRSCGAHQLSDC